ncbi:phosphomethylpyrimidine kinase [Halovivax ruber XH-70]|uniref:Phosphomethylpyrimidine kinase n=1 Tax=Halovivax ruber (strain DSM 18193 / JCM 13892 / XH-70) TaxID=797302 RepID=L0IB15_HALRX|nr:bifunctional hydroxymethylpyrimidine kinase/phosphomethylpyrimidine kinase [Halovivax ruber]AGB15147.1 phosphomethylpyrimidine kinase [Halovivax ruber XH-70]
MRPPQPDARPVALTIAGSDSGGGAGIQADLSTFAAHDVFGTSAITAVTAQHTRGVDSSYTLPRSEVAAQIDAVVGDFDVGAAKTGMLASADLVSLVADRVRDASFPVVVDPVMVATSGDRLLDRDAEAAYESLLAEATVVTPNVDEAAVLTDVEITGVDRAEDAGRRLLETGVDAALVKGGHVPGETIRDVLVAEPNAVADRDATDATTERAGEFVDGAFVATFEHERVDTEATHGSGCTLSAAIAARLARGDDLVDAVGGATDFVARAIESHYEVGTGPGAVNPQADRRTVE